MRKAGLRLLWATVGIVSGAVVAVPVGALGFAESHDESYPGVTEVQLDVGFFDVRIEPSGTNTARAVVSDIPRGITISDRSRGGELRLEVNGRVPWFQRGGAIPQIQLAVPAGIDLRVLSGSGDVSIRGLQGRLEIRTGSGDVEIDSSGGSMAVSVGSGQVDVVESVGELSVESSSGDVRLTAVRGILDIQTSSGDVDAQRAEITAPATFRTASGDIDVDFANELVDLRYRLQSSSGDLAFGSARGERLIEGGRGRFLVTGVTASGDQRYD